MFHDKKTIHEFIHHCQAESSLADKLSTYRSIHARKCADKPRSEPTVSFYQTGENEWRDRVRFLPVHASSTTFPKRTPDPCRCFSTATRYRKERTKHWVHRYPPISLQWTESLFLRVPLNDLPSVTVKFCFLSRGSSTPSRKSCADQWPRFSKPRRKWKLKLLTNTVHWILEDRLTLSIRSRDMEKREWNSVIY